MAEENPFLDFDAVPREAWHEKAEADLKGRPLDSLTRASLEGPTLRPLYTAEDLKGMPVLDSMPGAYPFLRGRTALGPGPGGWETRPEYDDPNPAEAARAIAADLERGADSLWFVLAPSIRSGLLSDSGPGVVLDRQSAMARLLRDLDLAQTAVFFEAGAGGLGVAGALAAVVGDATPGLRGGVLADPLAELARAGTLGVSLERAFDDLAELVTWCEVKAPNMACIGISTDPHHRAGASAVLELATALATGVDYLRALERRKFDPAIAASRFWFQFCLGRDLFVNVAKLRAARLLWARVCEVIGIRGSEAAMRIHARGSLRARSMRDPWVNMLRGTTETFAGIVGGADSIATTPLDAAYEGTSAFARRMALNTQVLLRDESHLGEVVDPAGGSFYVECLTRELAEQAWAQFGRIDGAGGVAASLESGELQDEIAQVAAERRAALAVGKLPVTGVSEFALLDEEPLERPVTSAAPASVRGIGVPADVAARTARLSALAGSVRGARVASAAEAMVAGAKVSDVVTAIPDPGEAPQVEALVSTRIAEPFEALRDAADAVEGRPAVLLANFGPVPAFKPRADFCRNLLASGGIDVIDGPAFPDAAAAASAVKEAAASVVMICSSDELYPGLVPELAPALRAAGARLIVVAGKPDAALEGIDTFVHRRGDALEFLARVHRVMQVIEVSS